MVVLCILICQQAFCPPFPINILAFLLSDIIKLLHHKSIYNYCINYFFFWLVVTSLTMETELFRIYLQKSSKVFSFSLLELEAELVLYVDKPGIGIIAAMAHHWIQIVWDCGQGSPFSRAGIWVLERFWSEPSSQ